MPCFVGDFNPAVGPLINVGVVPYTGVDIGNETDVVKLHLFQALIDTGATTTCISEQVIKQCSLEPTGKAAMVGVTGEIDVDQFNFQVIFLVGGQTTPDGNYPGGAVHIPVDGLEFQNQKNCAFEILLGRDVLCQGAFSLSLDGHYVFSI